MASKVAGVSVAYWFGISVILLAWVIVWLYVKAAARFDVLANDIVVGSEAARKEKRVSDVESHCFLPDFHRPHAGDYLLGVEAIDGVGGLLRRRTPHHGLAERVCHRGRLHERGLISRGRGPDLAVWS